MKHRTRTRMLTLVMLTMLLLCPIQVLAADGEKRSEDRSGRTENIPYRWSWKAEAEKPAFLPPH